MSKPTIELNDLRKQECCSPTKQALNTYTYPEHVVLVV